MEFDDAVLGSAAQVPGRDPASQDYVLADQILAVPQGDGARLAAARLLHENRLAREKTLTAMLRKLSNEAVHAAANSRHLSAKLARVKKTRDLKIKDCDRLKELVVSSGLMTREAMFAMLKNGAPASPDAAEGAPEGPASAAGAGQRERSRLEGNAPEHANAERPTDGGAGQERYRVGRDCWVGNHNACRGCSCKCHPVSGEWRPKSVRRIQVDHNRSHDDWTVVTINGATVHVGLRAPAAARITAIDVQFIPDAAPSTVGQAGEAGPADSPQGAAGP